MPADSGDGAASPPARRARRPQDRDPRGGGIATTCPYCGVGCGVLARRDHDGRVHLRGDPAHPANAGRLCSKGSALADTLGLEHRLLHPRVDGRRVTWVRALDRVAAGFSAAVAEHGPDSVALYVSGQLLTEDYYVANKLMKGYIGSANIDTNSRLCMASSVAGHRRAFGSDTVPGVYADLEQADLVVLTGSNLAWCHPVLYRRLREAKQARPAMRVVLIDPRRTPTAELADLHLPIRADGDSALFLGLLAYLAAGDALERAYIDAHTSGFEQALAAAAALSPTDLAAATGLDGALTERFYRLWRDTEKTVTVYSQGVNQSAGGSDKVNAIINCHLATGRIGRPGAGPFSVTGQPNAMGGREVGGLANMLACHMDIERDDHRRLVQRFWGSPVIADRPGLKAVDLFRAAGEGRIKALWIIATNPADSLPDGHAVEAALQACPFVVVSDITADTDTARHADVLLPATAWGEKDGTVTNSERTISRQRAFLPAPGEARPDWRIIADVAGRMGYHGFDYAGPAAIFAEYAALSAAGNDGARDFDIGRWRGCDDDAYQAMRPFRWPAPAGRAAGGRERFFADGGFYTPDRRARFVPIPAAAAVRASSARCADGRYPLLLNTGRVRDHWHTLTRTGRSARLSSHLAEPFVEIHPADAAAAGVRAAELAVVRSARGAIVVRAWLSERQQRGALFVPMHWTDRFAARGRVDTLVAPLTDPVSGQPALKRTPVAIERFDAGAYGFAVLRDRPDRAAPIDADYWALARCDGGWRLELAWRRGNHRRHWGEMLASLCGDPPGGDPPGGDPPGGDPPGGDSIGYHDATRGGHRLALFDRGRLRGALFVAPQPVAAARAWVVEQLDVDHPDLRRRFAVVAGRGGGDQPDRGAVICACLAVGVNPIVDAIRQGCDSVDAIAGATGAGSNCGSCRAELQGILDGWTQRCQPGAAD